MIFFCSGEGPSDIGQESSSIAEFKQKCGAMGALFLRETQRCRGDMSEYDDYIIISEHTLAYKAKQNKKERSKILNGSGAAMFGVAAYTLAKYAAENSGGDDAVAVLFRDADSTNRNSNAQNVRNSIYKGFKMAKFENGIAMTPDPISESWVLLMLNKDKYEKKLSHKNRLKNWLDEELKERGITKRKMYDTILNGKIDTKNLIGNSSFDKFREKLCEVLFRAGNGNCYSCATVFAAQHRKTAAVK